MQCRDQECMELYLHSLNTHSWRGARLKQRDNFTFTVRIRNIIGMVEKTPANVPHLCPSMQDKVGFISRLQYSGAVMAQYSDWATGWTTGVRFPAGVGILSRHRVPTGPRAHPVSCTMGTGVLFPGVGAAGG
jgi:hypothetical protein